MTTENHIVLFNSSDTERTFILEPWGEVISMPAGAEFHVVARGPPGVPRIDVAHASTTYWAWPGTNVSVVSDGRELGGALEGPPVPDVPTGMSVRGFLGAILGDGKAKRET